MEPAIPWYQSAIIRQQIVAFLVAAFGLFKFSTGLDIDATVGAILAGVAAIVPIWTILTRLFKPAPNLTATAANKEASMKRAGDLPTVTVAPSVAPGKQGGFVRASCLMFVALLALGLACVMSGCVGTQAAYKAANDVADTAYVVEEHYSAVVKEAADLAALPTTSPEVKAALKAADNAVRPYVLGDPATGKPSLRQLVANYTAIKNAQTEADLQAALNAAVEQLAKLINAVKTARS